MKDYIPGGEAEFSVWLENVNTKLPAYTDTLGVSHEDIAALQSAFNDVKAKIAEHRAMSTSLHSLTQAKVNVLASARSFVRKVMNRLKTHDRFTTVIGEDLGIIAPPQGAMLPGALDGVAPSFQLTVLPDLVRNDWVKGDFDGVVGQSRRNNETTWVSLGRDSKSPYDDTRPNLQPGVAETRYYRWRYILDDVEVGQWSSEMKVVCVIEPRVNPGTQ